MVSNITYVGIFVAYQSVYNLVLKYEVKTIGILPAMIK